MNSALVGILWLATGLSALFGIIAFANGAVLPGIWLLAAAGSLGLSAALFWYLREILDELRRINEPEEREEEPREF